MPWPKGKVRGPSTHAPGQVNNRADHNFKTCKTCGEEKTLNLFPFRYWRKGYKSLRPADPDKYADTCKACGRQAKNAAETDPDFKPDRGTVRRRPRETKKQTPAEKRRYQAEYKRRVRRRSRIACLRYLAKKGCEICGIKDPRVLEFDHIDPSKKKATVSILLSQGFTWGSDRVRKEVKKCRILCSNCHRLHTVEQQGYYGHDDVRSELEQILRSAGIDPEATH